MTRQDQTPPTASRTRNSLIAGSVFVLAAAAAGYVWLGRTTGPFEPAASGQTAGGTQGVTGDAMAVVAPMTMGPGSGAPTPIGDPMFVDVAAARGMNHIRASWGLSWNDYNDDGWPDLFIADHMHFPSTLYQNRNGLWFEPSTELGWQVGLDDHQVAFGDVDGDGLEDAFVAPGFYRPQNLFMNRGGGKFEEFGDQAGTRGGRGSGRSSMFVDFTSDGCLDIAAYNNNGADDYYRGKCDGTFADTTVATRMSNEIVKLGSTAGDLDNDGDIDFVSLTGWGTFLFINRGDGSFTDRSDQLKLNLPIGQEQMVGAALGDYDNDGDLDIYLPMGKPNDLLFRNRGDGTFEDVTDTSGIRVTGDKLRGAVFADFNNDTWLDIYIVEPGYPFGFAANDLLLNRGDGTFVEVSEISDVEMPLPGVPLAPSIADYNRDGLQDILFGNGDGDMQISGRIVLLENRNAFGAVAGNTCANWLQVRTMRLSGSIDDHAATVRVTLPDGRTLMRQAAPKTRPQAQDEASIHVGLGCASNATEIEVTWPDGHRWMAQNVPANQQILAIAGQQSLVHSHPAALLGMAPMAYHEVTPVSAQPTTAPDPSVAARREDEVLAYALVARLARDIVISDKEVKQFLNENSSKLGTEERVKIERMVLGVFTPRRKQPRLPWDVAKEVKKRFLETNDTALEIADDLNIRAWTITNPAIGRFWNIPGETRGYAEGGWLTRSGLERRFGPDLAAKVFSAPPGRVFGPVRQPELDQLFEPEDGQFVPDTLNLIKVVQRAPATEPTLAGDGWRVKTALERSRLEESIRQELAKSETGYSPQKLDWAEYNAVRYPVSAMAARARALGLDKDPAVAKALDRARREAAADAAAQAQLSSLTVDDRAVDAYMQSRPEITSNAPLLMVERMYFFKREEAERAAALLDEGKSFEDVYGEMEIPSLTSRKSRGASSHHATTQLWSHLSDVLLGPGVWEKLTALDVGQSTGIEQTRNGYQIFRIVAREMTADNVQTVLRASARRQLLTQLENRKLAEMKGGASSAPPANN